MYSMILPVGNAKLFVDQIFRIFDKDGNGTIDFKEFMMATDMTASGSPEEKLRCLNKRKTNKTLINRASFEKKDMCQSHRITKPCKIKKSKKLSTTVRETTDPKVKFNNQ